jgi:sulfite reductase alpha subunit-like flavoprotein
MFRVVWARTRLSLLARLLASVAHLPASAGHYSEDKPFWAKFKETRLLTSAECSKRVYHTALDVSGANMRWAAGDSFTVHPSNDPKMVKALLEHLQVDGSQCASLSRPLAQSGPPGMHTSADSWSGSRLSCHFVGLQVPAM